MRTAPCVVVLLMVAPALVTAQSFEVASVKPWPQQARQPLDPPRVMPGGRFLANAATVQDLIAAAYDLHNVQIIDDRRWTKTDRFDIEARTRPDVTRPEARALLRTLLADRFRLTAHHETRTMPAFVLTRAHKDGTLGNRLRPSGPQCREVQLPPRVPVPPPPPAPEAPAIEPLLLRGTPRRCPVLFITMANSSHVSAREVTMDWIAQWLAGMLQRPVVDRTSLAGSFDVDVTYTSESQALAGGSDAPSIGAALQEQLGLRLEATRAPVDVLVIDRVEPPTDN